MTAALAAHPATTGHYPNSVTIAFDMVCCGDCGEDLVAVADLPADPDGFDTGAHNAYQDHTNDSRWCGQDW